MGFPDLQDCVCLWVYWADGILDFSINFLLVCTLTDISGVLSIRSTKCCNLVVESLTIYSSSAQSNWRPWQLSKKPYYSSLHSYKPVRAPSHTAALVWVPVTPHLLHCPDNHIYICAMQRLELRWAYTCSFPQRTMKSRTSAEDRTEAWSVTAQ